jgi:aryl-phospho-beta-D-glucosidase BglC (GH1 family)
VKAAVVLNSAVLGFLLTVVALPSNCGAATITSVSPISAQQTQTIVIEGSGFGSHTPFNGNLPVFQITDLTRGWRAGNNFYCCGDWVTVNVTEWTDTKIVVAGFTGSYGGGLALSPGDKVEICVWNAQTKGSDPYSCGSANCPCASFQTTVQSGATASSPTSSSQPSSSSSASGGSGNLLQNPGFESQLTAWSVSEGNATYVADSSNPRSGKFCAKGTEVNASSLGRLYQDVTRIVTPGHQYKISGWIKTQNVQGGGGTVVALDYVGATGWTPADGYVKEVGYVKGTTGWTFYQSDPFVLPPMPADATAVWFLMDFNAATGTAWFDDLDLEDVSSPSSGPVGKGVSPVEAIKLMGRGINMGNTLEAPSEGAWSGGMAQEYYFDDYKQAGFTCVRIPVTWDGHTTTVPPYSVDTSWMDRVEQVVDWGLKRGLFIVLDAHHETWLKTNYTQENMQRFESIWRQIATRFKNKSDRLVFEILNEPHPMSFDDLNNLNSQILTVIRESNPTRLVVFSGNEYDGYGVLINTLIPKGDHLIGTFHYYDPYSFAGQGQGTWGTDTDQQTLANCFNQVADWSKQHNVPVLLGEFGAVSKCDLDSRHKFYTACVQQALANGFAFTAWDDNGDFQIYQRTTRTWNEIKNILIDTVAPGNSPLPTAPSGGASAFTSHTIAPGTISWSSGSTTPVNRPPLSPNSTTGGNPTITSVGPISPRQTQTITISGSGFGAQNAFKGTSQYLRIHDDTANWEAGYTDDTITVQVSQWTDSQITITGFGGDYGLSEEWKLNSGDKLTVSVWNAKTGTGPATAHATVSSAN